MRHPASRRAVRRAARLLLAALLPGLSPLALSLPVAAVVAEAARATPADDYVAARNRLAAEIAAAAQAGESDAALDKRNAAAVKDLQARMTALLGKAGFKGTAPAPVFTPTFLNPEILESKEPDGLLFSSSDHLTRFFVSPEPVFLSWFATLAKAPDAPPVFREGLKSALGSGAFYNAVFGPDAAFIAYMDLPVSAAEGESVGAALGLFTQSGARDDLPDTIVVARIANGRVVVGAAPAKVKIPRPPACDRIWAGYEKTARALIAAAEKAKNDRDPRWEASTKAEEEGAAAFQACFAKAAPALPFFAAAETRAQDLLAAARGN